MRDLFFDSQLQNSFNEKGYVKITLLPQEDVVNLNEYYLQNNRRMDNYDSMYAEFSVLNAELDQRRLFYEKITAIIMPKISEIMIGVKPLIANYVCKEPHKGFVPAHQNWAVVDEENFCSVSLWCPLINVDKMNGTLGFVDGSHKHFRGPRGSYAVLPFSAVEDLIIKRYINFVDVKAGEAIILDDSIIHYSGINKSDFMRLAVQLILTPVESAQYHYSFDQTGNSNKCTLYEVDSDFYLGMKNWVGDLKKYKKVSDIEVNQKMYNKKTFELIVNPKSSNGLLNSFAERVFSLFK